MTTINSPDARFAPIIDAAAQLRGTRRGLATVAAARHFYV